MPAPREPGPDERPDEQQVREMGQIARAVGAEGPLESEELARLVGARSWDEGRFDRALERALSDGLVLRDADGRLNAV